MVSSKAIAFYPLFYPFIGSFFPHTFRLFFSFFLFLVSLYLSMTLATPTHPHSFSHTIILSTPRLLVYSHYKNTTDVLWVLTSYMLFQVVSPPQKSRLLSLLGRVCERYTTCVYSRQGHVLSLLSVVSRADAHVLSVEAALAKHALTSLHPTELDSYTTPVNLSLFFASFFSLLSHHNLLSMQEGNRKRDESDSLHSLFLS